MALLRRTAHGSKILAILVHCHALYFRAGEPYRASHPAGGGDDCLAI